MSRLSIVFAALAVVFASTAASAAEPEEKKVVLKVGDKAPAFEGRTDQDKPWKSADHVGKKILVVYFYPADLTGGCTKQACAYRDAAAELKKENVEVIGVSGDTVENHQLFKKEHNLNFTLLADPEGKIAKAFGVTTGAGGVFPWESDGQTIELKRGATASRWTFIIDREGHIAHKNEKVDAPKDAEQTLKVVEKLAAEKPKS